MQILTLRKGDWTSLSTILISTSESVSNWATKMLALNMVRAWHKLCQEIWAWWIKYCDSLYATHLKTRSILHDTFISPYRVQYWHPNNLNIHHYWLIKFEKLFKSWSKFVSTISKIKTLTSAAVAISNTLDSLEQGRCIAFFVANSILYWFFPQYNKLQQRASPCPRNQVWLKSVPIVLHQLYSHWVKGIQLINLSIKWPPWGLRKMAIAERRLVWGGIGKLYDAPKPVFFLWGEAFLSSRNTCMLIFTCW